jgi:hypothetical protein
VSALNLFDTVVTPSPCLRRAIAYKGWLLDITEYDRSKGLVIHEAVRGDERVILDWSSHRHYSPECFEMMVDMRFPTRRSLPDGRSIGAMWPEDVAILHAASRRIESECAI